MNSILEKLPHQPQTAPTGPLLFMARPREPVCAMRTVLTHLTESLLTCKLTQVTDRAEHMPVTPVRMLMMENEMAPLVKRLKSRFSSCLYPVQQQGRVGLPAHMLGFKLCACMQARIKPR